MPATQMPTGEGKISRGQVFNPCVHRRLGRSNDQRYRCRHSQTRQSTQKNHWSVQRNGNSGTICFRPRHGLAIVQQESVVNCAYRPLQMNKRWWTLTFHPGLRTSREIAHDADVTNLWEIFWACSLCSSYEGSVLFARYPRGTGLGAFKRCSTQIYWWLWEASSLCQPWRLERVASASPKKAAFRAHPVYVSLTSHHITVLRGHMTVGRPPLCS